MTRTKRRWTKGPGKGNDKSNGPAENDDEGGDNREEFNGELHRGSFTLEELKSCDEYSRKIDYKDAPKRKWALNFGYLGSKYQGLQINPDANTVEKHLEKALYLAGGIVESNFANLHKIQWSRTARTDRGVHAVMQCCAMKLTMPLNGRKTFMADVNSFLPADIRMHSLSKVSKNFNSKMHCSKRRYHYLLPTYMMQDKENILNALNAATTIQGPAIDVARSGGYAEIGSDKFLGPEALGSVRESFTSYRVDSARVELLRTALKCYVGTQAYHNFTTGKHPTDANARRYVISFTCGDPFVDPASDVEWVLLSVVGQSFLLNQIRKMIGLATEVATGHAPLSMMEVALSKQKVEIPMAPGLGLYLDEVYFEAYNTKQEGELLLMSKRKSKQSSSASASAKAEGEVEVDEEENNLGEVLKWSSEVDTNDSMVAFREGFIWPHIFKEDRENLHFLYYLDYLRVFAYNFHVKDFKDKVLDKTEKTDVEGKSGGGGWKKDKRVRTEDGEAPAAVTASEVPTNDPQTEV